MAVFTFMQCFHSLPTTLWRIEVKKGTVWNSPAGHYNPEHLQVVGDAGQGGVGRGGWVVGVVDVVAIV